eukprot:1140740-Pelagomonas_calceolata.AAC.8
MRAMMIRDDVLLQTLHVFKNDLATLRDEKGLCLPERYLTWALLHNVDQIAKEQFSINWLDYKRDVCNRSSMASPGQSCMYYSSRRDGTTCTLEAFPFDLFDNIVTKVRCAAKTCCFVHLFNDIGYASHACMCTAWGHANLHYIVPLNKCSKRAFERQCKKCRPRTLYHTLFVVELMPGAALMPEAMFMPGCLSCELYSNRCSCPELCLCLELRATSHAHARGCY